MLKFALLAIVFSLTLALNTNTTLLFCDNALCLNTYINQPSLTTNTTYYIKLSIVDPLYLTWFILTPDNSTSYYCSNDNTTTIFSAQDLSITISAGFSIYKLALHKACSIQINVQGTLSQSSTLQVQTGIIIPQFSNQTQLIVVQVPKIQINSTLLFCDSSQCANTNPKPFSTLFVNTTFYLKHTITDAALQNQYFTNPSIKGSGQSQSTVNLYIDQSIWPSSNYIQQSSITLFPGYSIYAVQVPFINDYTLIETDGILSQTISSITYTNVEYIFINYLGIFAVVSQYYANTPTYNSSLITLATQVVCNQQTQIVYNNGCVPRSCLGDKLSRMQLMIGLGNEAPKNIGVLGAGFTYSILPNTGAQGTYVTVNISYADNATNQILGDPINCINFNVYSTKNSYSIDSTRQGNTTTSASVDGFTPQWPLSTYSYDSTAGALISFNMTPTQMGLNCLTLNSTSGNIEYDCFFEIAFQVRGTTQASYYFETQVLLNNVTNQVNQTNFVQQIQVATCVPGGNTQCQVNVQIASTFLFCDNYACNNPTSSPTNTLYLNRVFFMKLTITDPAFSSLFIQSSQITFQSFGSLQIVYNGSQLLQNNVQGSIIFNLTIPIVCANVVISVTGNLGSSTQRILQASNTKNNSVTTKSVNSGPVYDPNSISTSSSNSQKIHSSNGYVILASLVFTLLILQV